MPSTLISAQNLNVQYGVVYFSVGNKVYSDALQSNTISATEDFTTDATTLYGMQVVQGGIYVTDAKDYVSDGEVFIYSPQGSFLKSLTVGLIPNGVYFN